MPIRATQALITDDLLRISKAARRTHQRSAPSKTKYPHASIRISQEPSGAYAVTSLNNGPRILSPFPACRYPAVWDALDRLFMAMIVDRYDPTSPSASPIPYAATSARGLCLAGPLTRSAPPIKLRAYSIASVHRRLRVTAASTPRS